MKNFFKVGQKITEKDKFLNEEIVWTIEKIRNFKNKGQRLYLKSDKYGYGCMMWAEGIKSI